MNSTVDPKLRENLVRWRHELHRYPETGFEEIRTSGYVAQILQDMGLEVARGIGGTGLVASLTCGNGSEVIGLRADMDALNITEAAPDRPHTSHHHGKMHACGHDGHMAMLLGAARELCASRDFSGTVRFIFQPAEEHGCGAKAMIQDGVFERFPVDEIYGLHNMPGMAAGSLSTRAGGIMASEDNFVIRIEGRGGHAARPHMGVDPLVIAAQVILALQTVVSRNVDPGMSAVVSCTELTTDGIRNTIPSSVVIKGDTRSYAPHVQALLAERMRAITEGICVAHGASCVFDYTHEFVPTINTPACVPTAVAAAIAVVGEDRVNSNVAPMMISEDFGAFLQIVPGNFAFLGNGEGNERGCIPLHNNCYDFNDDTLEVGANYFASIVRTRLRA
jgi:amidohydrolase